MLSIWLLQAEALEDFLTQVLVALVDFALGNYR
jgi:hypothetical protein